MFDFIIEKKINSDLKKNTREHTFLKFGNIKKILILFTYQDWNEINEIAKELESNGKSVILWTVLHKNDDTNIHLPPKVRVICKKDFSMIMGLSTAVIDEYKGLLYDTLLNLTTKDDKYIKLLLANTIAGFSIGITESEQKFYDFVLLKEEDKNLPETFNQIKFYLNNIR